MIIKKKSKDEKNHIRQLKRIKLNEYFSNWHYKFYIYKSFVSSDTNINYIVILGFIRRRGKRIHCFDGIFGWDWEYKLVLK